jgi:hypothetical protein
MGLSDLLIKMMKYKPRYATKHSTVYLVMFLHKLLNSLFSGKVTFSNSTISSETPHRHREAVSFIFLDRLVQMVFGYHHLWFPLHLYADLLHF